MKAVRAVAAALRTPTRGLRMQTRREHEDILAPPKPVFSGGQGSVPETAAPAAPNEPSSLRLHRRRREERKVERPSRPAPGPELARAGEAEVAAGVGVDEMQAMLQGRRSGRDRVDFLLGGLQRMAKRGALLSDESLAHALTHTFAPPMDPRSSRVLRRVVRAAWGLDPSSGLPRAEAGAESVRVFLNVGTGGVTEWKESVPSELRWEPEVVAAAIATSTPPEAWGLLKEFLERGNALTGELCGALVNSYGASKGGRMAIQQAIERLESLDGFGDIRLPQSFYLGVLQGLEFHCIQAVN
eukprot:Hpha_TRINITY_DN21375_c0_g1::TRINITY_DN21375_c0_g1_i1::g.192560::m.192560